MVAKLWLDDQYLQEFFFFFIKKITSATEVIEAVSSSDHLCSFFQIL